MPSDDSAQTADNYDARSLRHERQMLAVYRHAGPRDGRLLQPLANACWRAACFEWRLHGDVAETRRLLGEGALALARGFSYHHVGFDSSPDQFVLALHLAITARERRAFTELAAADPNARTGPLRRARAFQGSRAHFHLAEGYSLVARSVVRREAAAAREAVRALKAARAASDRDWWHRQFPDPLDSAWRIAEHEAVGLLLLEVARRIVRESAPDEDGEEGADPDAAAKSFAVVVDKTLSRLEDFAERDSSHHPKLYLWLPGLALCALASVAGFPTDWLRQRHAANARGYSRLPPPLLRRSGADRA
jgi:hypothetical protein